MGHMRAECSKIGTRQPKYLSWRGGNFNLLFAGTPCTAEEVEARRAAPLLFASIEINGNIERLSTLTPIRAPSFYMFLSKLCIIRQRTMGQKTRPKVCRVQRCGKSTRFYCLRHNLKVKKCAKHLNEGTSSSQESHPLRERKIDV